MALMQTIHVLPADLINQIAAGEVVERPSSVLKELIENSLDAGATQIDIFLKRGGLDEISVLDDGSGMDREDLLLSTVRHATSKIHSAKDLEAISTFGFRGEALSSICSVATVELKTKPAEQKTGFQVLLEEGVLLSGPTPIAFPQGTQITVRHIFQHVPARLKFMRSETTELSHCQKTIKDLALGNPQVRFSLRHEERTLGTWIAPNRQTRLQECLKTTESPLQWEFVREEAKLDFLFFPEELNLSRTDFHLFVNGRLVRHRPFLAAIRSAFQDSGTSHQEPVGVCFLDIRKDWVDANVHPQKWEIRCLNQENLYQWIYSSLKAKLSHFDRSASNSPAAVSETFSSKQFVSQPSPSFSEPSLVAVTPRFLFSESAEGVCIGLRETLRKKIALRKITSSLIHNRLHSESISVPVIARLKEPQRWAQNSLLFNRLSELGFSVEHYGDGDLAFTSRPTLIKDTGISTFLVDFEKWLALRPKEAPPPFHESLDWFLSWLGTHAQFSELSHSFSLDLELEEFSQTNPTDKDIVFISLSSFQKGSTHTL